MRSSPTSSRARGSRSRGARSPSTARRWDSRRPVSGATRPRAEMRLIIVSGLSGSGKSVALNMLEDLGYYCVDNIPAGLLPAFIAYTVRTSEPSYRLTAVGVNARNRPEDLADVPRLVAELRRSGI